MTIHLIVIIRGGADNGEGGFGVERSRLYFNAMLISGAAGARERQITHKNQLSPQGSL